MTLAALQGQLHNSGTTFSDDPYWPTGTDEQEAAKYQNLVGLIPVGEVSEYQEEMQDAFFPRDDK